MAVAGEIPMTLLVDFVRFLLASEVCMGKPFVASMNPFREVLQVLFSGFNLPLAHAANVLGQRVALANEYVQQFFQSLGTHLSVSQDQ